MNLNAEQIREMNQQIAKIRSMVRAAVEDEVRTLITSIEDRFGVPIERIDVLHAPVATMGAEDPRWVLTGISVELGGIFRGDSA